MRIEKYSRLLRFVFFALLLFAAIYFLLGYSPETWVDGRRGLKAEDPIWRVSVSLAYTALLFLAATLMIGPVHVLRGVHQPTHHALRRDLGIVAGISGLCHMAFGLIVHTRAYDLMALFFHDQATPGNPLGLHLNFFGVGNLTGFFQAGVLILLLVLSNRLSINRLGLGRWKFLMRSAYLLLLSVGLHGFSFQRIEHRLPSLRAAFWLVLAAVVVLQIAGFIRRRNVERG